MTSYKDTEFIQGSDNKPSEADLVPGRDLRAAQNFDPPAPAKKAPAKKAAKKKGK